MKSLSEIEAAVEALSAPQKQELLLFLATRLRRERQGIPQPRRFTREQIGAYGLQRTMPISSTRVSAMLSSRGSTETSSHGAETGNSGVGEETRCR